MQDTLVLIPFDGAADTSSGAHSRQRLPEILPAPNIAAHWRVTGDVHLARRIDHALRATTYLELRKLDILVEGRVAILRGTVPSYFLKQIAQTAALGVSGVCELQNELDVEPPKIRIRSSVRP